jgi:TPR repeat protein
MWKIEANIMKVSLMICFAAIAYAFTTTDTLAQSARQLTRKIVPPAANQPQPGQTPPPSAARPTVPVPPQQPAAVPAPVDPAKEKAKQEEVLKKTIEFQKKRAAEGSPSAQYELGLRYFYGDGLEKNEAEGRKWIEESAKNDYTLAKKKLEELDLKRK